jgi:hypothetical protein
VVHSCLSASVASWQAVVSSSSARVGYITAFISCWSHSTQTGWHRLWILFLPGCCPSWH